MTSMGRHADRRALDARSLTYSPTRATAVADDVWPGTPSGFRRYERTVAVGLAWEDARSLLLRWGVKARSGFEVIPDGTASPTAVEGANLRVRFAVGPVKVEEPIRVVAVVDHLLRCGFAYGTLDGHPVSGEEAFVLHRATERGAVQLTIRSLTRPAASGVWRYSFPLLLAAQRIVRRRYLRSLDG
jgi:uncharacterized protein (UPF0548 family)